MKIKLKRLQLFRDGSGVLRGTMDLEAFGLGEFQVKLPEPLVKEIRSVVSERTVDVWAERLRGQLVGSISE